ncbi:hypothetical protein [Streptomyces sp. V4I8]|uniref:hypothetical protein n=1 Tax=Streptomyces sp. V4I8 TaxID=3156469 RepID=UPI00351733F5
MGRPLLHLDRHLAHHVDPHGITDVQVDLTGAHLDGVPCGATARAARRRVRHRAEKDRS